MNYSLLHNAFLSHKLKNWYHISWYFCSISEVRRIFGWFSDVCLQTLTNFPPTCNSTSCIFQEFFQDLPLHPTWQNIANYDKTWQNTAKDKPWNHDKPCVKHCQTMVSTRFNPFQPVSTYPNPSMPLHTPLSARGRPRPAVQCQELSCSLNRSFHQKTLGRKGGIMGFMGDLWGIIVGDLWWIRVGKTSKTTNKWLSNDDNQSLRKQDKHTTHLLINTCCWNMFKPAI